MAKIVKLRQPDRSLAQGMITFGEFLRREIDRRGMSLSEFARLVGVSHQTISKYTEFPKPGTSYPPFELLVKLSEITKTDLGTLAVIVEPAASYISPQARFLAERIERLDAERQQMIDALIMGFALQNKEEKM